MKRSIRCPACGGRRFRQRFEKKDRVYWRCLSCGLEKQHPLPSRQSLVEFYESSYRAGLYRELAEAVAMKEETAARRFSRVREHIGHGPLLDVGCADGRFVEHVLAHGIDAEGIDLSQAAVERARQRGLPVRRCRIHEFEPRRRFAAITAFDVIEHVLDPRRFVDAVRSLLEPGGVAVLSTPNLDSVSRRIMGKRWYFYIPEEHLHCFQPRSLGTLLDRAGFDLLRCEPMAKPLTFAYGMTQLAEYNPWIHRILQPLSPILPRDLQRVPVPLHIGEMIAVARARQDPAVPLQRAG